MVETHNIAGATERLPQAEIDRITKECEQIGWQIHGKDIPITWHRGDTPGVSGWFYSFDPKYGPNGRIFADIRDIEKPNNPTWYGHAIALHEHIHPKISRLDDFTPEELRTHGFLIGFNWVEDNADENYAPRAHKRGREWMMIKAKKDCAPNGGLDYRVSEATKEKLGYIPEHMLVGGMMRQYFFGRELTGDLNVDGKVGPEAAADISKIQAFINDPNISDTMRETFKKLLPYLEDFYQAIPSTYDSDELVEQYALDREKQYREKIWPIYKEIVGSSMEDEALKKLIEKLAGGGQVKGVGGGGGQVIIIDFDSLPDEVKEEIQQLIDEAGKNAAPPQPGAGMSMPGAGGGNDGEGQLQPGEGTSGSEAGKPQPGQGIEFASGKPSSFPIDKLSPKSKAAAKQFMKDKVSSEDQAELEGAAKQSMGEAEDAANEALQGHTDKPGVSPKSEVGKSDKGKGEGGDESGDLKSDESDDSSGETGGEEPGSSAGQENKPAEPSDDQSSESASTQQSNTSDSKTSALKTPQSSQPQSQETPAPPDTRDIEKYIAKFLKKTKAQTTEFEDAMPELDFLERATDAEIAGLAAEFDELLLEFPELEIDAIILDEELRARLKKILEQSARYSKFGKRFSIRQYIKGMFDPREIRFFERRNPPKKVNISLTQLIDMSGSTQWSVDVSQWGSGAKPTTIIDEEVKIVATSTMAAGAIGIPVEVHGYTSFEHTKETVQIYVKHDQVEDENLTDEVKAGLMALKREAGGGTPTAESITRSWERIKYVATEEMDQKDRTHFLIIMTDGVPDGGTQGVLETKAAIEAAYQEAEEEGIKLVVIGLGVGAEVGMLDEDNEQESDQLTIAVKNMFPRLPVEIRDEIAVVLSDLRGESVNSEHLYNAFRDSRELAKVYAIILDYAFRDPEAFREMKHFAK